ncbi:MAG TPA: lysylphosphatidylglycerol synthase transmembrane domain-containing protein [Cellulomonas sp.]
MRRSTADRGPTTRDTYREVRLRRTPADAIGLLGALLVMLAAVFAARVADRTVAGIDADLTDGFARFSRPVAVAVLIGVQIAYLALVVGAPVALLARRRFGLLARSVLALVAGPVVFALLRRWLGDGSAGPLVPLVDESRSGMDWPPTPLVAAFAAVVVVVGPAFSRWWRRTVWALLALLAITRVATASGAPLDVVLAIGVGAGVGSLILLVLGRSGYALTTAGVRRVLATGGLPVRHVEREGGRPVTYRAVRTGAAAADLADADDDEAGAVEVKVIDEHEWRVDRLTRAYRRARWRGVGDDEPFASPGRAVAAEAMVGLLAASRGVQVPAVRAVARAPRGEALLATDAVRGRPLAELDGDEVTDELLDRCWEQVARLRAVRVAHRQLDTGHLVVGDDGRVHPFGLDRGEPGAEDTLLAGDVAELLASTSAVVGPQRATAAVDRVLGRGVLGEALTRLVPAALTAPTRQALKAAPEGLAPLVEEVCRVTGVDAPTFEDVERIKPRVLLMGVMLGAAVYFLAPQLTDLPAMLDAARGADLRWVPAVVAASLATYVGAALGLAGGTPGRVSVPEATGVALASSFVATFAPPGVGQVGLNIRYLQKRGFPTAVAVSASAAKETAVMVVHLTLLAGCAVWAGSTGVLAGELQKLPPLGWIAAALGVLLGLGGLTFTLPRVRAMVTGRLIPAVRSSAEAMAGVLGDPVKLATLFGGVVLLPLGYAVCLYVSVRAVGADASFVAVALVSLTAGTVAQAAPTPGGIGAVEAVLLASLTGIGLASAPALAAVLVYRLATFWLPIAPGALAFRALTRREVL